MLANHTQRSLETAAVKTLERIRRDRGRVVRRLQPLLQHIEEHLFDPGLDVNQLKRSCGVRDNSVPIQFHAQIGLPPHAYIEECRLRTGCRLLRDTELKIWQIADLLGYSSIQVFSRAFSRWASMRPTGFRRRARREGIAIPSRVVKAQHEGDVPKKAGAQGEPRAQVNGTAVVKAKRKTNGRANGTRNGKAQSKGKSQDKGSRIEVDNLRRALDGELEASDADKLIRRLLNLYPAQGTNGQAVPALPLHLAINGHATNGHPSNGHRANGHSVNGNGASDVGPNLLAIAAGSVGGLLDGEEIETLRAEELWRKIKDEPIEAQIAAVQHEVRFRTPALFHHLCTRSLVDGRDNRKRGVRVAELALVALEAVKFYVTSEKEFAILQGEGFAWLGNARRLAMDYLGAEKALIEAEKLLPANREETNSTWSILLQNQAALRWNQRRMPEALSLCNEAIALLGGDQDKPKEARLLLLRGNVNRAMFNDQAAAQDFGHAVSLLETGTNKYLLGTAYQALFALHVRADQVSKSLPFLARAREIADATSSKELTHYLEWYEGLAEQVQGNSSTAEALLLSAMKGFLDLDSTGGAAITALDLAIVYSDREDHETATKMIFQALPLFEALGAHGEMIVLLGLAQKAARAGVIKTTLLRRLRNQATRPA